MDIAVRLGGAHPLDVEGYALAGYHRPLSGEAANLTVTCDHAAFFPGWLAAPPLGLDCTVEVDAVEVMAGVLYGVRVTTNAVELKVEG